MKLDKLTCKACGAPITRDSDVMTCEHCGTSYTVTSRESNVSDDLTPLDDETDPGTDGVSHAQHSAAKFGGGVLLLLVFLGVGLFMIAAFNARRPARPTFPNNAGNVEFQIEGDLPQGFPHSATSFEVQFQEDLPPEFSQEAKDTIKRAIQDDLQRKRGAPFGF